MCKVASLRPAEAGGAKGTLRDERTAEGEKRSGGRGLGFPFIYDVL
jgi:hypothetical protein